MAESTPYLLPNTQGRYVTSGTATSGSIFRINDNATRDLYADYFVEPNGTTTIVASEFASAEFTRNLAQNSQAYKSTIGNSIIQATGTPTQTPAPNPDQQGGSTPVTQPTTGTEPTDTMLVYPEDLKSNKQDRIMLQAFEYKSGNRLSTGAAELSAVQYVNPKIPVILPIQSAITDQNSVGWESDTLNPLEKFAAGLSRRLMGVEGAKEDIGAKVSGIFAGAAESLKVEGGAAGEAVRTFLVGQAIGVNNLQSRLLGQVLNPNLELLFQGPQLRPFNFTFKMSARSRDEAKTIKKIIKYFKKNMATKKSESAIFLRAPNVFKIQYQYGDSGKAHPGLNLIKMCALTNCSVDYTPLGTYMTFNDGTMIAYTMTLSFQELTPIYDTDYDKEFKYGDQAGTVPETYFTEDLGIGA